MLLRAPQQHHTRVDEKAHRTMHLEFQRSSQHPSFGNAMGFEVRKLASALGCRHPKISELQDGKQTAEDSDVRQ